MQLTHALKLNEKFHCEKCGMEIQITKDCPCDGHGPEFRCCDTDMIANGENSAGENAPEVQRNLYTA